MSNKTSETNAPASATPQPPAWELPSLDRVRTQAIMAAILFASRGRMHDPLAHPDYTYTKDLRASVAIAGDLLRKIEQHEQHYLENRLMDESGQPDTVGPQS
jgi:hypothetical protein